MNKEKTDKLFGDFPNLYRGRFLPKTENLMSYGFAIGGGWFDLVHEMSSKITELDPDCLMIQMKEKFGGLRVYCDTKVPEVLEIISEYEALSYKTCEFCGTTIDVGSRSHNGWLKTLCNECSALRQSELN